jgi:hypothetical protein
LTSRHRKSPVTEEFCKTLIEQEDILAALAYASRRLDHPRLAA